MQTAGESPKPRSIVYAKYMWASLTQIYSLCDLKVGRPDPGL